MGERVQRRTARGRLKESLREFHSNLNTASTLRTITN